jgi:hypothetical protein
LIRFSRDPGRPLTRGERALVASMFGRSLDPDPVCIHRAKWFPLQPRNVAMAPDGHIWFHPDGGLWRGDFSKEPAHLQALFMHELTHVWQHQRGLCLLIRRHPFCRYSYRIEPGRRLLDYGIEQQAMIVEHLFLGFLAGNPDETLAQIVRDAGLDGLANATAINLPDR